MRTACVRVSVEIFCCVILTFINNGDLIIIGALTPAYRAKIVLTNFVLYSIASWTATRAKVNAIAWSSRSNSFVGAIKPSLHYMIFSLTSR